MVSLESDFSVYQCIQDVKFPTDDCFYDACYQKWNKILIRNCLQFLFIFQRLMEQIHVHY
jgi:hypothetical protein